MGEVKPQGTTHAPVGHGHEPDQANVRGLFLFLMGLFATLAVTAVLMAGLFWAYFRYSDVTDPGTPPLAELRQPPPTPRLQAVPVKEMQQYLQTQEAILTTYGWVDRQQGVVRMPVEKGIELYLRKIENQKPKSEQ